MYRLVAPFLVLPRTSPACAFSQTLCSHSVARSLSLLSYRRRLFSIACALFGQNTGGGVPPKNHSFEIINLQTLLFDPVCNSVTPTRVFRVRRVSCPRKRCLQ